MKKYIYIILLSLSAALSCLAQTTDNSIPVEKQQQFLYYFYEAERLHLSQEFEMARSVFQFCHKLNPYDATVNFYLGLYFEAEDNTHEATQYYQRAYQLNPTAYWKHYHIVLLQSKNKQNIALATKQLSELAKNDTKNSELYEILQQAHILQEQYKQALLIQDQLDSINGYNAQSAMQRYRLNAVLKNYKQAIYEIERYLEDDPDNYQFQIFRMQLYEQTNQPNDKLIIAYEAVLRLDPRNVVVMNNLAWSLCTSGGNLLRAEELSRYTIMKEPTNPIYLDTYAWILYHLGDYQSALFYIQRAAEYSTTQLDKEITTHYKEIQKKCK